MDATKAKPDALWNVLLGEHAHISASLLENRRKGAARFTLYVALLGLFAGVVGFRRQAPNDGMIIIALVLLSAFGLLMLLALIRRSIVTDKHLEALEQIRAYAVGVYPEIDAHIPTIGDYALRRELGSDRKVFEIAFETQKLRYYKNHLLDCSTARETTRYLRRQVKREWLPHYGDLIETVCALNSLVMSFLLTWLVHVASFGAEPGLAFFVAFLATAWWLWAAQMVLVWYKHTANDMLSKRATPDEPVDVVRPEARARRRPAGNSPTESELQEKDAGTPYDVLTPHERTTLTRIKTANWVIVSSMFALVAVVQLLTVAVNSLSVASSHPPPITWFVPA